MATDVPRTPALARASLHRAADERAQEDLVVRLRADATTGVVAVHGDRAPLTSDLRLLMVAPDQIREGAQWAFLGRDEDGTALLVAATGADDPPPVTTTASWGSLRAVGGALPARDAGILVEAVALGGWMRDAPFCPACGARTLLRAAGWSRRCPACGREHFPRADPAVIVAVTSEDGSRLLLGKNVLWTAQNRYSTFAGFVEAGESLESTIAREVEEEAGVAVADIQYRGSQAWPYPRSLMIGFRARCTDEASARPDGDEIVDVRWFSRAQLRAGLAGTAGFALPGTASIAHRLIVDWVEDAR